MSILCAVGWCQLTCLWTTDQLSSTDVDDPSDLCRRVVVPRAPGVEGRQAVVGRRADGPVGEDDLEVDVAGVVAVAKANLGNVCQQKKKGIGGETT